MTPGYTAVLQQYAAHNLQFEKAAHLRDETNELRRLLAGEEKILSG